MNIIGGIQAYNEGDKIAGAVESLFAVGCDRVVVLDGPWSLPDGSTFADGPGVSMDDMHRQACEAGATVVVPRAPMYGDGGKRDRLVKSLGAQRGDRVLLLDADERVEGMIDRDNLPPGHALVMLRNLRANDLPGIRKTFPRGDYGELVPLIRWLVWTEKLACEAPGRYVDERGAIKPYVKKIDECETLAEMCHLPIVQGIEIIHAIEPDEERVQAKRDYYAALQNEMVTA